MTLEELKTLSDYHSTHIQQLNQNIAVLDSNMTTVLSSVRDSIRDVVIIQQTIIQFLTEKEIISEDDQKLFQKIYARNVALIDQQSAQRRDIFKPKQDEPTRDD